MTTDSTSAPGAQPVPALPSDDELVSQPPQRAGAGGQHAPDHGADSADRAWRGRPHAGAPPSDSKENHMAVPEGYAAIPEVPKVVPGAHERSLYRWSDAGKLPAKTIDGVKYVEIAAVQALVAAKNTASAPAATGLPPSMPPAAAGGGRAVEDGELASVAFAGFDEGLKPRDLVQRLKTPPGTALTLWKQWRELLEAGGEAGPTTADRFTALERRLAELVGLRHHGGPGRHDTRSTAIVIRALSDSPGCRIGCSPTTPGPRTCSTLPPASVICQWRPSSCTVAALWLVILIR